MNAQRRRKIAKLIKELDVLHTAIEELSGEEQEAYDNMPESLQGGDKGSAAEDAIQYLDEAASAVDDAKTALECVA